MIVCYVSKRTDCEMDAGIYEVVLHRVRGQVPEPSKYK